MTPEEITRALAAIDYPPIIDGTYANGHDWCRLCEGEGEAEAGHDPSCPWRAAREWARRTDSTPRQTGGGGEGE